MFAHVLWIHLMDAKLCYSLMQHFRRCFSTLSQCIFFFFFKREMPVSEWHEGLVISWVEERALFSHFIFVSQVDMR